MRLVQAFSFILLLAGLCAAAWARYPTPSPSPVSWELKFDHSLPKRIVVAVPGQDVPQAFWYMTYTLTNPLTNDPQRDKERVFYPVFEMLMGDGVVTRSDNNIPLVVFDEIKRREGARFLENANHMFGEIRLGEDQARDGVAIWPETSSRMGAFSIFVSGIFGETAVVKMPDGKEVTLHRTLQLNYHVNGDQYYPDRDEVTADPPDVVMR